MTMIRLGDITRNQADNNIELTAIYKGACVRDRRSKEYYMLRASLCGFHVTGAADRSVDYDPVPLELSEHSTTTKVTQWRTGTITHEHTKRVEQLKFAFPQNLGDLVSRSVKKMIATLVHIRRNTGATQNIRHHRTPAIGCA